MRVAAFIVDLKARLSDGDKVLTSVLNEQSVPGVEKWLKTASVKGRTCLVDGDLGKFVMH